MTENREPSVIEDDLEKLEPVLDARILRAVREMGFDKLTPIQAEAIPVLLEGKDIIGQAQTGTGKTAAFGIPMLMRVDPSVKKLQGLVLCPTRELAMQAAEELRKIAKYLHGIKVLPVYGGQDISRQINALKGVQIIVGTPGRVMDHMRRKTVRLDDISMVVLDEADEMLDMGFREDMEHILGEIEREHQTALFSATMAEPIKEIATRFQKDAKHVKVAAKELTIPLVSQRFYRVRRSDKEDACVRLLEYYQPKLALIFCNTKTKVDELTEALKKRGFMAEGIHGDLSQHQRDVAMSRFKNGAANILIATDVVARGIDISDVEAVINYDIPQDMDFYVHRIGRTGRAGKTGRSFTLGSASEVSRIKEIERYCKTQMVEKKIPAASKVYKARAEKYLEDCMEYSSHKDMDMLEQYIEEHLEEKGVDPVSLAAMMLKKSLGEQGRDIPVDDFNIGRRIKNRLSAAKNGKASGRGHGDFRGRARKDDRGPSRGRDAKTGRESDRRHVGKTGLGLDHDRIGKTGHASDGRCAGKIDRGSKRTPLIGRDYKDSKTRAGKRNHEENKLHKGNGAHQDIKTGGDISTFTDSKDKVLSFGNEKKSHAKNSLSLTGDKKNKKVLKDKRSDRINSDDLERIMKKHGI
ncbi:MAG: DEAD/DEAH box helicase [Lachnospiraceae bacterium]|nr:DEAD/DEAH box helicase [Lachnospiraceae bacterium]